MPTTIIREAIPTDAASVHIHLIRLAGESDNTVIWIAGDVQHTVEDEAKTIRDYTEQDNALYLVAMDGSNVVGSLTCKGGTLGATKRTVSLAVSVHRDYRNRGIGTQLMQHCLDWAWRVSYIHRVELQVFAHNDRAIHIYEKLGFVREGVRRETFYKSDRYIDSIIMGLILPER